MVDAYQGLDLVPEDKANYRSISNSVSAYEFDYFSGTQITVYIADILVEDIQSIQFSVMQTKSPIYGYGSQYYHTLADGQILVEGTFSVPFKEADYILAVLQHYTEDKAPITQVKRKEYKVARENIERYLQRVNKRESAGNPYELAQDLGAVPDEVFEDMAEEFEDLLWRKPEEKFLEPNAQSGKNVSDYIRRADQLPPFDMNILYGDISNASANHTIKKLIDVSIIGQGQAIHVGGEPVVEQYRFICKNLA